ncbi:MAG: hypothetical protein ABMB14_26270 [Myxococcota bacterium]
MIILFAVVAAAHPTADEAMAGDRPIGCDADRWLAVARSYAEERRAADALGALDRAAACGAEAGVVALHRGLIAPLLSAPRDALPALDAAIDANPNHVALRLARGRALAAIGRPEAALVDVERALTDLDRPQPDDVLLHASLLDAVGDPEGALTAVDDGVARLGPAPGLVARAVALELALGRPIAALARLDGLPDTPSWLDLRGTVAMRAGHPEGAADAWSRARSLALARPTPTNRALADALTALLESL